MVALEDAVELVLLIVAAGGRYHVGHEIEGGTVGDAAVGTLEVGTEVHQLEGQEDVVVGRCGQSEGVVEVGETRVRDVLLAAVEVGVVEAVLLGIGLRLEVVAHLTLSADDDPLQGEACRGIDGLAEGIVEGS